MATSSSHLQVELGLQAAERVPAEPDQEAPEDGGGRLAELPYRPTIQQVFGDAPPGANVAYGLPSPSELVPDYFREIQENDEPRFPLCKQEGCLRLLVVGDQNPRVLQLEFDQERATVDTILQQVADQAPVSGGWL